MKLSTHLSILIWLAFLIPGITTAQCLTPELALINSCIDHPNPNGNPGTVESELLVLSSGIVPIPVSEIGFDLPFNGFGPENGDVGVDIVGNPLGCIFKEPDITGLPGCDNVIALGPNDIIPANVFIVFFVNGTTTTLDLLGVDFSSICQSGETIYVLQSACERTAGAFANGAPASGDPLRTITTISPCGLRSFTYNTQNLDPDDGTYYLVGFNETGNLDCSLPVIPETCPAIDTTFFICDPNGMLPTITAVEFASIFPEDVLAVSFHPSPAEAEGNDNRITSYTTTGEPADTIYSRIINSSNLCIAIGTYIIKYQMSEATTVSPVNPLLGCDPGGMGTGLFNLRLGDAEIGGGQPITYYLDATGTMQIMDPEAFSSLVTTIFAQAGIGDCRGAIVPVCLDLDNGPVVMVMVTEATCPDNLDGTITLSPSGTGTLTFNWEADTLPQMAAQTGLQTGDYTWSVTNENGCVTTETTTVGEGLPPQLSCATASEVSMPGAIDGVVNVEITEGESPFQVAYSGAAAGAMEVVGAMGALSGLPAGNFAIVATDAPGCISDTCFTTISLMDPLVADCMTRNDSDGMTVFGAISVIISGGEPLYTVTLTDVNGGSTTLTNQNAGQVIFNNLPVGTYTVTVTDATGQIETCMSTIILDNCPLRVVDVQLLALDCSGTDNVVIRLTIAGSNDTINTVWSGGNGIGIFNGMQEAGPIPPGSYFVEVTDQSGCTAIVEGPIDVVNPGLIESTIGGDFISPFCNDEGRIDVTIDSGGTAPYAIHLTDENGLEISVLPGMLGETISFTDLPGGDGSVNYQVFVTDAFDCSPDTFDLSIVNLPRPNVVFNATDQLIVPPTCTDGTDGSIMVSASGGTMPYVYNWVDYPERSSGRILAPGDTQLNLPFGDYVIEVAEGTGCLDTLVIFLSDGTRPTINCGLTTSAIGTTLGTITFTVGDGPEPFNLIYITEGGSPVVLSNISLGDTTITMPAAGNYLGAVIDANGCVSDSCAYLIIENPCLLSASAAIAPIDCSGPGQIVLSSFNGLAPLAIDWADPAFPDQDTVTPTMAGDYPVTITDANGCVLDTIFSIQGVDDRPELVTDSLTVIPSCEGDSIRIQVAFIGAGPFVFTYQVGNGAGTVTPDQVDTLFDIDTLVLPAIWFTDPATRVTAFGLSDSNCDGTVFRETFYELTRPDTIRRFDVTCRPEGFMIGGRLFTSAMPSDTFIVADGSLCGQLYEVDLTFLAPEVPDTLDIFICSGTSYEHPGTMEVFNAGRPEGEITFTRNGQCDSLIYIRLDIPVVNFGSFGASACDGDTIFFGDRFFTIDDPDGIARLAGMAADGCDSLVTVNVNFRRVGQLRLLGDHNICPGDSIELRFAYDGQGGVNAVLEDLSGNIMDLPSVRDGDRIEIVPTTSTTWSIISVEAGGCPGRFNGRSVITINDVAVTTEVLLNPFDFCNDTLGRGIAFPSGGVEPYDIVWNNGPTDSLNPNLLPGTYQVEVTDAEGCVALDSIIIDDRVAFTAELSALPPNCVGGSGRLVLDSVYGGAGFYEMSLDGEFFLPIDRVGDFRPPIGFGIATFQDSDDCVITVPYTVPDAIRPEFNPLSDTIIFIGDSILLDPQVSIAFDTVWWTPPGTLSAPTELLTIASPRNTTVYTLYLLTEDGCALEYSINVRVDERLPVYAPTVFSPNGDNINDVYRLEYSNDRVRELLSFQVFNRWGTMVHDGPDGWDGMLNGQPAQTAVYVFQASVLLTDGTERFLKGDFVLMR
ncbi:MAG: gliding motility-associated-like protein [Neolewinella sp.]|jgi:gliding motility-associated-like protein